MMLQERGLRCRTAKVKDLIQKTKEQGTRRSDKTGGKKQWTNKMKGRTLGIYTEHR